MESRSKKTFPSTSRRQGRPKLDQKCFPADHWKHSPNNPLIETSLLS
jgi:hypothetical protein